jgi:sugar phosphate isomerase/epimerase
MWKSGLVSISFRNLTPEEIVKHCAKAGLAGIEWGGDVHVPHGKVKTAAEVRKLTVEAGLQVASYGSYYKAGVSEDQGLSFEAVLDSALELQAKVIRVWAGEKGSDVITADEYCKVVEDLLRIGDVAEKAGINVSMEYHRNTLTDTNDAVLRLKNDLKDSPVGFFWQPAVDESVAYRLSGLRDVKSKLANMHVFQWINGVQRCPLSDGIEEWTKYLAEAADVAGEHFALLEFIKDDSCEQLYRDAHTLNNLLTNL